MLRLKYCIINMYLVGYFMKKIMDKLKDKTGKLNKVDYWIMGIMVLIYGIISFYHLGSFSAPKTFYNFNVDDSITINLPSKTNVSKIMYYTGSNIGNIEVLVSDDGIEYQHLKDITTYNVLSWEDNYLNIETISLKFVGKSNGVTIGELALYDFWGNRVNVDSDSDNPLLDELDLIPDDKSYLNSLYFDEIYYARCAYEYSHGIDCFEWSHPPLGKVLMTLPVVLFGYSTFNVRLMGNIIGILLIPIMYMLTKKIFKNRQYAFLGAILMMFDTFHFVHTRIALIDGYQILFILLSVLFMKNYLDLKKIDSFKKKSINLLLSGLFIGCAIATKWNACYVAIGLAIVFFVHLFKEQDIHIIKLIKEKITVNSVIKLLICLLLIPLSIYYSSILIINKEIAKTILTTYLILLITYFLIAFIRFLIKNPYLGKLFFVCVISFVIVPLMVYILSYIIFPNVSYYNRTLLGIVDQTKLMYDYHANLVATHPFSSSWYQWPIMYKPVWFYSKSITQTSRLTIVDIGNPVIWWFGIISFVYLVISGIKKNKDSRWILVFILSTFIPYIFIGRIMFMYHYFITLPFIMLGIVAFIKWITEKFKTNKIYWLYICLVIIVFIIFFPVVSGINVSEDYINSLKWLSSWIF